MQGARRGRGVAVRWSEWRVVGEEEEEGFICKSVVDRSVDRSALPRQQRVCGTGLDFSFFLLEKY